MAAPSYVATLQVLLSIVGNGVNEQDQPIGGPVQNTTSPGIRQGIVLASGNQTIAPPQSPFTTSKLAIIVLTDATAVYFKGVNGDTGYRLGTAGPSIIELGSAVGPDGNTGSFVLNSAGTTPIVIWWV